ncbi:helix-turn-helix transcriptional regulator [Alicyclobacillus sp.]|uniref:helix-turn-helix domain-containing protein n=1 Tax=Alicyclobacillus sp. TaxID=61169 RepID=UPI0025BFF8FB|nr:helix-turn-helix transcriptional regulator [Alicyclobacillus sp.]MCL6516676.1 helix-turn-helix transcriptional regulator [Alicyclobacillus sp.]
MEGLGTRLKKLRLARNLTVRELAQRAGVSVSYVYAIEAGSRGHNLVKLQRIADALGVPLSQLWGESGHDSDAN